LEFLIPVSESLNHHDQKEEEKKNKKNVLGEERKKEEKERSFLSIQPVQNNRQ